MRISTKTLVTMLGTTAAGSALCFAPVAMAAGSDLPPAPAGATTAGASAADAAAKGALGETFASSLDAKGPSSGVQAQIRAQKSGDATVKAGSTVNVYMLTPQFVKDGSGPVGQFTYAATSYAVKGNPATVYSAPVDGTWQGVNIATGRTEQQLAAKAGTSSLLFEPQVRAYYAVKGDTLQALNDSARKAIGGDTISVSDYAKQVHAKYGSMLPGSAYDKSGKAGGFEAAPAGVKASESSTSSNAPLAAASIGGAAALAGATVAVRRRRS